jgi:hypothetical protein
MASLYLRLHAFLYHMNWFRKSFSYIHCSPWIDIYVSVSLFGKL